jgi:hypothetical protein
MTVRRAFTCSAVFVVLAGLAPALAAQRPRLIVSLPAFPTPVLMDSLGSPTEVDGTRERVFAAVLAVYADLKIPVTLRDSVGGLVGNTRLIQTGRLGKERLSRYLECGAGMTGPNADTFRVQIAIATMIQTVSATRTQIKTALAAGARNLEGNSSDAVRCGTTGELEIRIAALVSSRLSAP